VKDVVAIFSALGVNHHSVIFCTNIGKVSSKEIYPSDLDGEAQKCGLVSQNQKGKDSEGYCGEPL
jgi:hypothetical protein